MRHLVRGIAVISACVVLETIGIIADGVASIVGWRPTYCPTDRWPRRDGR